jgi:replicative DNA helicase
MRPKNTGKTRPPRRGLSDRPVRQSDYPGATPRLTDIAGSDGIAQAADTVILLHRPEAHVNPLGPEPVELILAKNRYDRRQTVTITHNLDVSRFTTLPNGDE